MAVDLEKKGHIGVITMNRPEALNALNTPMLQELEKVKKEKAAVLQSKQKEKNW